MIVLDTNVLSELLRPRPEHKVVGWLQQQVRSQVFTTAISRGEMLFGVLILPAGRRRQQLLEEMRAIFDIDLRGRVLSYDGAAATAHAQFAARRRAEGRPVAQSDAMIAGIACSRGAALATRNTRDFEGCGIELVDPWH